MSKHNFTEEEIKNLSSLLLNEEETNVQLGLQLIEKQLGVLDDVENEVLLIAELHANERLRTKADNLLTAYFDGAKLSSKRKELSLFTSLWRTKGWADRKPVLENYILNHETYAPYLVQNKLYIKKLEGVLYQVVDSYIWADNDLITAVSLPAGLLSVLTKIIETIAPTLLNLNKNYPLALECLMFVHAVPAHRSAKALEYYERHQDLQYWAKWLNQRLGEVVLFVLMDIEKAILFFEKANADKDFEGLDLFVAKLANSIYLDREQPEQKPLADGLLQLFLAKYKESIHAHVLWANRLSQEQETKEIIQQEYFKILDRLPKGLMLTGSVGWVGLMHIDKRFKNEFDVDAFVEHTELLIEELPHPKQLEQASLTLVELLEWNNHPSYQDELLILLSKIKEIVQ